MTEWLVDEDDADNPVGAEFEEPQGEEAEAPNLLGAIMEAPA